MYRRDGRRHHGQCDAEGQGCHRGGRAAQRAPLAQPKVRATRRSEDERLRTGYPTRSLPERPVNALLLDGPTSPTRSEDQSKPIRDRRTAIWPAYGNSIQGQIESNTQRKHTQRNRCRQQRKCSVDREHSPHSFLNKDRLLRNSP